MAYKYKIKTYSSMDVLEETLNKESEDGWDLHQLGEEPYTHVLMNLGSNSITSTDIQRFAILRKLYRKPRKKKT